MGRLIFQKIDMSTVVSPPANAVLVGVDTLDGLLKFKDEFGVVNNVGGITSLSALLNSDNDGGGYNIKNVHSLNSATDTVVVDITNRGLFDSTGNKTVGWEDKTLRDGIGEIAFSWENRIIQKTGGETVFDGQNQELISPGVGRTINWKFGFLFSQNGNSSVDWDNRKHYNNGGLEVIDWQNQLLWNNNIVALDWNFYNLRDSVGTFSLDWTNRRAYNAAGTQTIVWDSNCALVDNAGQISTRWDTRFMLDENGAISLWWGTDRKLMDPFGGNSIVWRDRTLYANDGSTIVMDWSNPSHIVQAETNFSANITVSANNSLYLGSNTRFICGITNWNQGGAPALDDGIVLYNSAGSTYFYVNGNTNNAHYYFQSVKNGQGTVKTDMIITNDGNVGIGTITPSHTLEVNGSLLVLDRIDTTNRVIKFDATTTILDWGSLTLSDTNNIALNWSSRNLVNILGENVLNWSTTFVQISGSNSDVDLVGTDNKDLRIAGDPSGNTGKGVYLKAYNGGTWRTGLKYLNVTSGEPNLILAPDFGNVGVGIAPIAKLHVSAAIESEGSGSPIVIFESSIGGTRTWLNSQSGYANQLEFLTAGNLKAKIHVTALGESIFYSDVFQLRDLSNNSHLYKSSTGLIGINTTTHLGQASVKLAVAGESQFSDTLWIGSGTGDGFISFSSGTNMSIGSLGSNYLKLQSPTHIELFTNGSERIRVVDTGLTITTSIAPVTPVSGDVWFDGTDLFVDNGTTTATSRQKVGRILTGSATLDFPDTPSGTSSDLTITVNGAAIGDSVSLGIPSTLLSDVCFTAFVSAIDTVTVRFNNYGSGSTDPISGTYKVVVFKN